LPNAGSQSGAAAFGGLDILVNNSARPQTKANIADISHGDFDATMKTSMHATFLQTRAALRPMKPGSAIIQSTSVQAYDPSEDLVAYALTKSAVVCFTKSMAKQLGPTASVLSAVTRGPIWTPLQVSGGAAMEKLENFGSHTPLGRPGQPAELASIYVQLAAEDTSFATVRVHGAAGGDGQP